MILHYRAKLYLHKAKKQRMLTTINKELMNFVAKSWLYLLYKLYDF